MPPRKKIERNYDDMIDENALHVTPEQIEAAFAKHRRLAAPNQEDKDGMPPIPLVDVNKPLYGHLSRPTIALVNGRLYLGGFVCTPTGLVIEAETETPKLEEIGVLLSDLEYALPWLIGDWLVIMVDTKQGDIPSIASAMGREERQLRKYMYVARYIEYKRRSPILSFKHHEVVVPYAPDVQDRALRHAEANMLSVAALRRWLESL